MDLTAQEISLLMHVMRYSSETTTGMTSNGTSVEVPKARQFQDEELSIALPIFSKLKKCIKDDKFVDSEIDLNTEEKAFLLKLIVRPWTLEEAEIQLPLKDKLKK